MGFDPTTLPGVTAAAPQASDSSSGNFNPAALPGVTQTQAATPAQPQPQYEFNGPVAKAGRAVTNFLFPIVGDVANDITGQSNQTALQQLGAAGLSALPFIPGLGEEAEGARATTAATEGTGDLLTRLSAPVSLATGNASPVLDAAAKGAVTGYGAGVASNLMQGQGIGKSMVPNTNNIVGALTGGLAAPFLDTLSTARTAAAGISPQIEAALKEKGISVDDYNAYMQAAKDHSTSLRATSPQGLFSDTVEKVAQGVTQARQAAGQDIGAIKKLVGNEPLGDMGNVVDQFVNHVEDQFGITLVTGQDGSITAMKDPERMVDVPQSVSDRIVKVFTQLKTLASGASLQMASDVAKNVSGLVDYSIKDKYGETLDPLKALFTQTDGAIRGVINDTSPELAQANANFSGWKNIEGEIAEGMGSKLQRSETLMKRIFSGSNNEALKLFTQIKNATGIDLIQHAALAAHAIASVGSDADKSVLQHVLEAAQQTAEGGPLAAIMNFAKGAVRKTVANPESIGRGMVQGTTSLIPSLVTKGLIETGARGFTPPNSQ